MKHAVQRIHFVGIGGTGMSGIAEILHNLGYVVSGSDLHASATTDRLAALGVRVAIGHDAAHVADAQAVVVSSAVADDNPEVAAARAQRIPVVARAVMLGELMRLRRGIAVAGTHGKTTTTSLVATVLAEAGLDPTFVIGGKLLAPEGTQAVPAPEGRHALAGSLAVGADGGLQSKLGAGEFIVVEADESDASFLNLSPVLAVVTNIDADHMDTYGHDLARLHGAFVDFLHRLPFYGAAIVCCDDPGVQAVLPSLARPIVTYGLGRGAMVRAVGVRTLPGGRMAFVVERDAQPPLPVELNLAGVHNVRNALAAIAVAAELELPDAPVQRALARFAGVGRRFQRWGELPAADGGRYTLIDDYGHHPAEMAAVLAAARGAYPGQRIVLAFQPHRYSRTRDCLDDFAGVLRQADAAWVTEVYAAGEAPIAGVDGATLAQRAGAGFVADIEQLPALLDVQTRGGDVVIVMGAGSIGQLPPRMRAAREVRA